MGLDRDGKAGGIFHSYGTDTTYAVADYAPRLKDDASDVQPTSTSTGRELLLNVDIEKDADGDGFGDQSQDNCPQDSAQRPDGQAVHNGGASPHRHADWADLDACRQHHAAAASAGLRGAAGPRRALTGRGNPAPLAAPRAAREAPASERPATHPRKATLKPRAKPPRPTGPDNSSHGNAPSARPKPPRSNAPAPGGHDNGPKPRSKPVAQHQPTRRDGASPNPRPKPPTSLSPTAVSHTTRPSPRAWRPRRRSRTSPRAATASAEAARRRRRRTTRRAGSRTDRLRGLRPRRRECSSTCRPRAVTGRRTPTFPWVTVRSEDSLLASPVEPLPILIVPPCRWRASLSSVRPARKRTRFFPGRPKPFRDLMVRWLGLLTLVKRI